MNDTPPRLGHPEIGLGLGIDLNAGSHGSLVPAGFTIITDSDGLPILDSDGSYIWEAA